MRVAIVTTSYPLHDDQAAGHFVQAEAQALVQQGHEVVVIAPGPQALDTGASPRVLRIAGQGLFGPPGVLARLRENPLRARGALAFMLRARRWLAQQPLFDELVGHWLIPCAWPIGIGKARRLEAVAHGTDVRFLCALPRPLREHVARTLMREGASIRCVSTQLCETLIAATLPALRAHVRVQPSPLALGNWPDRRQARSELGVADQARLIVIVSRLVPDKRVETALSALAQLPGVDVVVVGGGPLLPRLRREYPQVRFTGEMPRSQSLAWISAADLLVSASRHEGAPTVVREARAMGTAVLACAAGDLEDWARHDPGLWVVPSEDPRR
jgi:glycosyltransferase involved in cell wall biosynthesis